MIVCGTAGVGVIAAVEVGVIAAVGVDVTAAITGAGVGVAAMGVGVTAYSQIPLVIVLESSVTAPFLASNCPWTVAPVWADIDVNAKM